jgi:hypothetical protein
MVRRRHTGNVRFLFWFLAWGASNPDDIPHIRLCADLSLRAGRRGAPPLLAGPQLDSHFYPHRLWRISRGLQPYYHPAIGKWDASVRSIRSVPILGSTIDR